VTPFQIALHTAVLLALPPLLLGVINRTKALWAGRKGPRLLQGYSDLRRLLRKRPVYSEVTTEVFRLAPLALLASTLLSGLFAPVLGPVAPASFPLDFVLVAYLWGIGRLGLLLGALDTGSPFEGMGASREAIFAALAEPLLLLALGTLAVATGHGSFAQLVTVGQGGPVGALVGLACAGAIFVFLQVETSRVPVDDPATHLELTMVHEVMVLDHAGPELAAIQYAAALKLTICASFVASLANPFVDGGQELSAVGACSNLVATGLVAVAVGCVESLVARLRMRSVPDYIVGAAIAAGAALLVTAWWQGGAR
jgi:formate hydrogenlyase subunit 4